MKIGITADCSSGIEYAPFKSDVKITRTTIHFGNEELLDGVDITADDFYKKLRNSDIVPSTSAPTPGEIAKRVEEWKNEGCTDVIHFPISFGLSDYGKNLQATGNDLVEGVKVHVFNSNTACLMEGYQAKYASILAKKGYSVEEIFAECAKVRDHTDTYLVVDDIKYLVKNGRLSGAAGFIGGLAKIKPVLNLGHEGKILPFEKVRTHPKAIARCIDVSLEKAAKYKKVLYIVLHTDRLEDAKSIAEELKSRATNCYHMDVTTITPTVGAHIGCGVIGIASIALDDLKENIID
ncbi:MAG: DegV family protein [Bacilli bacterium]|nr:DegV family protein [Acholeplasmataceae bacterium]MDY2902659.1 DegV family protein [Bacilli bacterium]